ncbi:phosphosulfolactate synthase [Actinomycetospora sp. NBRC 106375]|uniref:phosphosulfolactate synthase n=1 Tax=Actinomycetospora sp. NBRC 106375 TaxID=3032207 RepID=UPI0024A17D3A|nr:phosphosulfolactate synthase [Actinomycetospora sp. NBRC 106375]GLZ49336.1 phosphosulfolactate synthase [Actinomycetospora sp. NBRC 106375]
MNEALLPEPQSAVLAGGEEGFLSLPVRTRKPRLSGITHVLDKGMPPTLLGAHLDLAGESIDFLKLGWGTGYLDPALAERVTLCREASVTLCTGGTFLEIAEAQGRRAEFARWAAACGFGAVEVSNGLGLIEPTAKRELISMLAADFVVLAETGSKNPAASADPAAWVGEIGADLDAGATLAVAEGRESGTVGLYEPDGRVREEMVDRLTTQIPLERLVFEAPRRAQQVWLIRHLGPAVNLGNVDPTEVLPLETLRLGLRADTAELTTTRALR